MRAGRLVEDMMTAFIFHPDYLLHDTGPGHPERPDRLRAILQYLEERKLLPQLLQVSPEPAEEDWILKVHTPAHLRLIKGLSARGYRPLDPDTWVSPRSYEVARLAAGAVLAAVDAVMEGRARNAFAAVRPPGHHALPERAMGFCLFNNVAIGARYAQGRYGLRRVLIIDWDVHHGNGTQEIFYEDPEVLYFSTHQYPHYPGTGSAGEAGEGRGAGTTLNVPLQAGSGDSEILEAFREKLFPAAEGFRPDFVFISAGFDAHREDPLGGLTVSTEGFSRLTELARGIAEEQCGGRLVSVLEGGYNLSSLSASVAAHLLALMSPRGS